MSKYQFMTECNVPHVVKKRLYDGCHIRKAKQCLLAGCEDNAASWMWRDWGELMEFNPVAGTLEIVDKGILYIDAEDVALAIANCNGGGI
jgi:hypothetical protein